jgi:signal transduction histidine kinase
MAGMRVVTGLRRNGEEFPIDASISQLAEEGQKFFTVILRDVTERVRAEQALRQSKEELQLLASAAHQTREHEQSRIARELHDELGQSLTALKMLAVQLRETAQAGAIPALEKLDRMEAVLDRTVAATRRIAADLRPLMLDDLGLVPAIEWLAEEFSQRHGVACVLTTNGPELELAGPQATAAFRIVQEALTNVARHAQARKVDIDLTHEDSSVTIRVRDDGRGFVVEAPSREPGSRGLLGMRERAYLLGGSIAIESAPGRGTAIEVRLPLQAPQEAA